MVHVIHMNSAPPNWQKRPDEYVYIGRPGRGVEGIFGNPNPLMEPTTAAQRKANIAKFEVYFVERLQTDPDFYEKVKALDGKTLVCFCKPKACHGDVIAKYVEKINDGTVQDRGVFVWPSTEGQEI